MIQRPDPLSCTEYHLNKYILETLALIFRNVFIDKYK